MDFCSGEDVVVSLTLIGCVLISLLIYETFSNDKSPFLVFEGKSYAGTIEKPYG